MAAQLDDHTLSLSPDTLATRLQHNAQELLLLDLRSFINFNQGHLQSSINVCVPNSLIKRKNFSLANVESTISCDTSREKFKKREGAEIVLYDGDCDKVKKNCVLASLVQKLREENLVNSVHFLQGGFQSFVQKFPHFCNLKAETIEIPSALCLQLRALPFLGQQQALPTSSEFDKEPVEILDDFLFVGSQDVANSQETLDRYRLTYILNAAKECICPFEGSPKYHFLRLELLDHACQNLDVELFERAFQFIDEAKAAGQRVLVHCRAGQSRSATIVITYLIHVNRWSLQQAYKFVQEKRPSVSPNLGFMSQIVQFEKIELGRSTCMQQLHTPPAGPLSSPCRTSDTMLEFRPIDCK